MSQETSHKLRLIIYKSILQSKAFSRNSVLQTKQIKNISGNHKVSDVNTVMSNKLAYVHELYLQLNLNSSILLINPFITNSVRINRSRKKYP